MRLLVVGGNPLMGWIVQHLVPDSVSVELAATLEAGRETILHRPPDAVVVRVIPKPCPCREIVELCRQRRPPIPTLFYSGAYLDPDELDAPAIHGDIATEPADLRRHLDRLIEAAEHRGAADFPPPTSG